MFNKIFFVILVDQITKAVFSSRDFFFGPIKIYLKKNFGLPFGIEIENTFSILIVTLILFYFIFYFVRNKSELNYFEATGFSLVFGGAISNLVDRLTLGYVRDFLDVSLWSVFNFADVAIATGLLLIVFGKIFQKHFESGKVIK